MAGVCRSPDARRRGSALRQTGFRAARRPAGAYPRLALGAQRAPALSSKAFRPVGFRLIRAGSPCVPGREGHLAPGVRGYALRAHGAVYIPLIVAECEGRGDVGRFLDRLPAHTTFRIPAVVSGRLRGMLERRGWAVRHEDNVLFGEVEVFELAQGRERRDQ